MKTHFVDTQEYLNVICEIIRCGEEVSIPVKGISMQPFLKEGRDAVILASADQKLQIGDIILYRRQNGQYVLHRIVRKNGGMFYLRGDAHSGIPEPVRREQICALAVWFHVRGQWLKRKCARCRAFSFLAISGLSARMARRLR